MSDTYLQRIAEIDSLHAQLLTCKVDAKDIHLIISGFNRFVGTNCQGHAEAMLYAVLPVIVLRPELEFNLLYFPVKDLVAGGLIEPPEFIEFIQCYVSSQDNYQPLKTNLCDWFFESRGRLTKVITEILDQHWPR